MKKIFVTLALVTASALSMFGQGRVAFNNINSGNVITITNSSAFAAPGEGAAGANVGSTYSIQLLWAPVATYNTEASFLAAVVGSSSGFAFFGTTGGSPGTDGAGLFDGSTVPSPVGTSMPAGAYTMQARAWYNGGVFSTYALALAGNANTGYSSLFNLTATASPTPAPNTIFPSFQVALVPEPSTFALAGLGAAALMIFRRKK
jgi:hypothetical protein